VFDHFHCVYEFEGQEHEIEAGFTCFPKDWEARNEEQKRAWWRATCIVWGMPPTATIKSISLAR
jgi:hypothetical protein